MNSNDEQKFISAIEDYPAREHFFFFHILLVREEYADDPEIITPVPFLYDDRAIKLLLFDNTYGIVLNYLYKFRDDLNENVVIPLIKKDFECVYYLLKKKYFDNNESVSIEYYSDKEIAFKSEDILLEFNYKYFDNRIVNLLNSSKNIQKALKDEIDLIVKKVKKAS